MNFTYNGADKSNIIKRYERHGNTYFIEYLDGHVGRYDSEDKDTELNIQNIMIQQAIERQEKMNIVKFNNLKNTCFALSGAATISTAAATANGKHFLAGASCVAFVTSLTVAIQNAKAASELKKYKLFLELIKEVPANELRNEWFKYLKVDKIFAESFDINSLDKQRYGIVKSFYKSIKSEKK